MAPPQERKLGDPDVFQEDEVYIWTPEEAQRAIEEARADEDDDADLDAELADLDELLAGDQAMFRRLQMVRHGATALNDDDASIDRIRGWVDVPLSNDGRAEAEKLARKMARDPPDVIVTSDLSRAHDTARIISEVTGAPIVEVSRAFRPWNVGHFTGELSEVAVPKLREYLERDPEEPVPGGESFCEFRDRYFAGLADALARSPGVVVAVVAHHRNERLMLSWQEAGFPEDGNIDVDVFTEKGERTGSCLPIDVPMDRLEAVGGRVTPTSAEV